MKTRAFLCSIFLVVFLLMGCKPDPFVQETQNQAAIEKALEKAQSNLSAGKTEEGLNQLKSLTEQYPENSKILEASAMAYQANGQWVPAAKNFEKLSQLDPDELQFLMYAAQMYIKAGLIKPAIALYDDYLEQFPEDYGTWWTLSELYASQGNPANALQAAQNSIRYSNQPLTPAQNIFMAGLYERNNDPKSAIPYYEKGQQGSVDERNAAQVALFKIYVNQKSWSKAQTVLNAAQNSKTDDPALKAALDAYFSKRESYLLQKQQTQQALAEAQQSEVRKAELATPQQAEQPPAEQPHAEQAKIEPEAVELAEKNSTESLHPAPSTYAEKAVEARNAGNNDEAIRFYWKAIALDQNTDWYWFDLSRLYYEQGDYNQAQMAALEANRITPNLPHTLCMLKAMQHDASQDKFLAALEEAKKNYPMSPEITIDLAIAYQKIQNNNRNASILAQEFLDMAGSDHPRSQEALVLVNGGSNQVTE